jgi:hypothetical protein
MVDVMNSRCVVEGCNVIANYGVKPSKVSETFQAHADACAALLREC